MKEKRIKKNMLVTAEENEKFNQVVKRLKLSSTLSKTVRCIFTTIHDHPELDPLFKTDAIILQQNMFEDERQKENLKELLAQILRMAVDDNYEKILQVIYKEPQVNSIDLDEHNS